MIFQNYKLFFFLCLLISSLEVTAQKSRLHFNLVGGFRTHDDKSLYGFGYARNRKIYPAAAFGLDIYHDKYPFLLSIQRDYAARFFPYDNTPNPTTAHISSAFRDSRRFDRLIVYWRARPSILLGLGQYLDVGDNVVIHALGAEGAADRRGLEPCFLYQLSWLSIEVRHRINYSPFNLLNFSNTSFVFLYSPHRQHKQAKTPSNLAVRGIFGGRVFIPKGVETVPGERLGTLAFAPVAGIEFYLPKHHLSFNLDKSCWIGINAGSLKRNLKGYITNTSLGAKYHQELNNAHHLRYGVAATWIDDFQTVREKNGFTKLRYSDFGVTGAVSYELVKNWDVEVCHTVTLVEEKRLFNLRRLSLGLVHRFEPRIKNHE